MTAGELMSSSRLTVFTDGGSRGNPGSAAVGVYICDEAGNELEKYSKYIGRATNNIAEYSAVVEAINLIKKYSPQDVLFKLDSELVVRQLNGDYKVKDPVLKKIYFDIKSLLNDLDAKCLFTHIKREENKVADMLVNIELDKS